MKNVVWVTRDKRMMANDYNVHAVRPSRKPHREEYRRPVGEGVTVELEWRDNGRGDMLVLCPEYLESILPKQDHLKPGDGPKKFWLLSDRQYQALKKGG